jgi:hypothetical protein
MSAQRDGLLSTAAASKYKTAGKHIEDDKSEDDPDE